MDPTTVLFAIEAGVKIGKKISMMLKIIPFQKTPDHMAHIKNGAVDVE